MGLTASVLFLLALGPKPPLRMLFIGNSHTAVNDLPVMVQRLLESDGSGRKVEAFRVFKAFLNDGAADPRLVKTVKDPKWDYVVLQAAQVSSSHQYVYDNTPGVGLAKLALKNKARVLWFVEWPRRGWDESDYQYGIYRGLQRQAPRSELVPVCYAWDELAKLPQASQFTLWQSDGNHATPAGTFLAANVFYYFIAGSKSQPTWTLPGLTADQTTVLRRAARAALAHAPAAHARKP